MSLFPFNQRVMTTDYKVKGFAVDEVRGRVVVEVIKSTDPDYPAGKDAWLHPGKLLKCSPFWKGWITIVAPLLVICAMVIAFDEDYNTSGVVWAAYAFSSIAAFGARCYQYFVQWR